MLFSTVEPFIKDFIEQLGQGIQEYAPSYKLSKAQRCWLEFCLMEILLSNQICWAKFERIDLGNDKQAALSWMFRHSKLLWSMLLHVSVMLILKYYGIREGVLVGDDSDRRRAKVTKRIFATHKLFDKKSGGYFNGQTVRGYCFSVYLEMADRGFL